MWSKHREYIKSLSHQRWAASVCVVTKGGASQYDTWPYWAHHVVVATGHPRVELSGWEVEDRHVGNVIEEAWAG
jgi:hypothetical protein